MNKWNYNTEIFLNEDQISFYLLGALMADGCITSEKGKPNTRTISISSKDRDWLELINNLICPNKPLYKKNSNCFYLMYHSKVMSNWLISQGCVERKSLILEFPAIPKKYLKDFIRGCWDGDGSISCTKSGNGGKNYQYQANLTSGSLNFCQELCLQLQKLGINSKIYLHKVKERKIEGRTLKENACWRVIISSGRDVYNLVKLLYGNNPSIFMPRKYAIAQKIIELKEMPKNCEDCSVALNLKPKGLKKKYCERCLRERNNRKHRERYASKNKKFNDTAISTP